MHVFVRAAPRPTIAQRIADILRALADWLSEPQEAATREPIDKPFPFLGD